MSYSGIAAGELITAEAVRAAISDPVVIAEDGTQQRFLSERFGVIRDVVDYGAAGDGSTADHAAIQAAADAIPSTGGVLYFPPKRYSINQTVMLKSKTVVMMRGAWIRPVAQASWSGDPYSVFFNENHGDDDPGSAYDDEDMIFIGGFLDYTDLTSSPSGNRHPIRLRRVTRVAILGTRMWGGNSAAALLGCISTNVERVWAEEFANCGIDHWDAPEAARVKSCYLKTAATNQMINFNPESESPYQADYVAKSVVVEDCDLIATGASAEPVQLEPLSANNTTVEDVRFVGNRCVNVALFVRGGVRQGLIAYNQFRDNAGGGSVITTGDLHSLSPQSITIIGNQVFNPTTSTGFGVIRHNGASGAVIGNTIYGFSPGTSTHPAIYITDANVVRLGNWSDHLGNEPLGHIGTGGVNIANGDIVGLFDNAGSRMKLVLQTDNNLILKSTDSGGAERNILSHKALDDDSELNLLIDVRLSGRNRYLPDATLTAAGSTQGTATLISNAFARFTTVGSGEGGRLKGATDGTVTGSLVRVRNDGANALNVYPPSGGAIDALGTNNPYSLAVGASRWFYAWTTTVWESWA